MTLATPRAIARLLLVLVYLGAGYVHLASPEGFLPIVPDWVPSPRETVLVTGIAEILGAIGLLFPPTRRAAGWGLAAYAVCVFPANIKHAVDGVVVGGVQLGWGYHLPRLLFQPVIVWWALFAAAITDWPFVRRRRAGR